jgi:hypothetical protein
MNEFLARTGIVLGNDMRFDADGIPAAPTLHADFDIAIDFHINAVDVIDEYNVSGTPLRLQSAEIPHLRRFSMNERRRERRCPTIPGQVARALFSKVIDLSTVQAAAAWSVTARRRCRVSASPG